MPDLPLSIELPQRRKCSGVGAECGETWEDRYVGPIRLGDRPVLTRIAEDDDPRNLLVLAEIQNGLKGRPQVKMPASWPLLVEGLTRSKNAEVRTRAIALAATFGDTSAFKRMREILADDR